MQQDKIRCIKSFENQSSSIQRVLLSPQLDLLHLDDIQGKREKIAQLVLTTSAQGYIYNCAYVTGSYIALSNAKGLGNTVQQFTKAKGVWILKNSLGSFCHTRIIGLLFNIVRSMCITSIYLILETFPVKQNKTKQKGYYHSCSSTFFKIDRKILSNREEKKY